MAWKNLPTWLKGLIIGSAIGILLSILGHSCMDSTPRGFEGMGCLFLFYLPAGLSLLIIVFLPINLNYEIFLDSSFMNIANVVISAIFGAIIGLIISKIKSVIKKNKK